MSKEYCSQCGYKLNKSDKFCPGCGTKIEDEIPNGKEVSNKEKRQNKQKNSNKTKISKKQAIIIGLVIIIGIVIISVLYGELTKPNGNIEDFTVEKDGKLYQINYTYQGDGDELHVSIYKDGQLLATGEGSISSGSWIQFKLDKDIDIDEIRFTVYDNSNGYSCVFNEAFKDFDIIKVKNLYDSFEDADEDIPDDIENEIDDYEIAKSHRDLYDYDGDGLLNDYEFRQFCIGEGQEELLDY